MRVLLFTGKGGVGKTTVAAATALRCAELGHRTIVLSTDPAHSLADALDCVIDSRASEVAHRLWAVQLDATERLEETWGEVQEYLVQLFDWAGAGTVEAEELSILPGLDELFALTDINQLARSSEFDVVIVDCAPTADTLRLLSLPDILSWYMQRLFPVERRIVRMVRPVVSRLTSVPVADDSVFAGAARMYRRMEGVRELLSDTATTSVRLVVNPEKMVIAEARRTSTYLGLFGYHLDAVVANRLLPEGVTDPWFKAWKAAHAEHLQTIDDSFAPVPVLRAELAAEELVGPALLSDFAAALYGEADPSVLMHHGPCMRVDARGSDRVLGLHLPFADPDDLELGRKGDDLLVRVGAYRRPVALPDSLRRRAVAGAKINDGWLEITFGRAADG